MSWTGPCWGNFNGLLDTRPTERPNALLLDRGGAGRRLLQSDAVAVFTTSAASRRAEGERLRITSRLSFALKGNGG